MAVRISLKHKNGFWVKPLTTMVFPAGEVHVKGFETTKPEDYTSVVVDARFSSDSLNTDVLTLRAVADSLTDGGWEFTPLYLLLPYLPGARADRGKPFGANLYGKFIAEGDFTRIYILDPHSPVMPELMQETWPEGYITEFPFERIIRREIQDPDNHTQPQTYDGVIAPDAGAKDRATRAATVMGVPVYMAGKSRDFTTGKLTGFHMEDTLPAEGRFLLVDDICDGGGTFMGLAQAIKKTNPDVNLDLWVTHGVFSNEVSVKRMLEDSFGTIHTTNSFNGLSKFGEPVQRRIKAGIIKIHNIDPYLYTEVQNHANGLD